jgi:DNA-binding PadR family transcriptional regulator
VSGDYTRYRGGFGVSVAMSLLAILEEGPTYGLHIKNEFEARTGSIWPLNVGQVYSTLGRLERDGLVRVLEERPDGQKVYGVTEGGRDRLRAWFDTPTQTLPPARSELVLKLIMSVGRQGVRPEDVIQAERRSALELLQEFTLLKRRGTLESDLGWAFLLDSLIFETEARVRWLDDCEARLSRRGIPSSRTAAPSAAPDHETSEVSR